MDADPRPAGIFIQRTVTSSPRFKVNTVEARRLLEQAKAMSPGEEEVACLAACAAARLSKPHSPLQLEAIKAAVAARDAAHHTGPDSGGHWDLQRAEFTNHRIAELTSDLHLDPRQTMTLRKFKP